MLFRAGRPREGWQRYGAACAVGFVEFTVLAAP